MFMVFSQDFEAKSLIQRKQLILPSIFVDLILFIMSKLYSQSPCNAQNKQLQLKFFIGNNCELGNWPINKKQNPALRNSLIQQQQCIHQNIDPSLLNYKNHYLKDIQTRFPDDNIISLLICPKIISNNIQLKSPSQWRNRGLSSPQLTKYWFPLFFNHKRPLQYFQQISELLSIIIQRNGVYLGFLGYVPQSIILYQIFQLLADLYDIKITEQTCFCTQQCSQYAPIEELKFLTVRQAQGKCIKISSKDDCSQQLKEIPPKNLVRELSDLIDLNDLSGEQNRKINYQEIDSQLTNHAALSQNWQSNMQIQTNFQQKNEFRINLITKKTMQEVEKIKNRVKLNMENASIRIPNVSEESMRESLNNIVQQLQNNLRLT